MRVLFYILFLAALLGSTAVVLWMDTFNGLRATEFFINGVMNGTFTFGATSAHFYFYGLVAFFILNAATLLTLFLIVIFSGFNFKRIRRPYTITIWLLVSTMLLSGAWLWPYFDVHGFTFNFQDKMYAMIPLAAALAVALLGLVFSFVDRRR